MTSPPPKQRPGSCLCGAVKYTIGDGHGPDLSHSICYCTNCLHSLGNFNAVLMIAIHAYQFIGDSQAHVRVYRDQGSSSGKEVRRQFCSLCGSCILITFDHNPRAAIVPVGTLNDGAKGWFTPTVEVFVRNKYAWMPEVQGVEYKFDTLPPGYTKDDYHDARD